MVIKSIFSPADMVTRRKQRVGGCAVGEDYVGSINGNKMSLPNVFL